MATKRSLSSLLPDVKASVAVDAFATESKDKDAQPVDVPGLKESDEVRKNNSIARTKESPRSLPSRTKEVPQVERFDELERKEARFREDQLDSLERLTKRIKRTRAAGGERITDNTLIRVAVDLLISQGEQLRGSTEAELRKSMGL